MNSISINDISEGLTINFNGNNNKNRINLKNNLENALDIVNNNDTFLKIKTVENDSKIIIYKDIIILLSFSTVFKNVSFIINYKAFF